MAELFFLLAGIILFFKKEVRISSKKTLSGRPVKILAVLYVLPSVSGFVFGIIAAALGVSTDTLVPVSAFWVETPLVVVAILVTLYYIFVHKDSH